MRQADGDEILGVRGPMDVEQGDRLTLKDFMQAIGDRQRLIWASVLVCVAFAVLILIIKPPVYTATMVVAPAPASNTKPSGSSLSNTLGSISGLITGASNTTSVAPMDEFLQLIISPRVAERVVAHDPTVLTKIFPKEWNPETKQWHPPHDPISLIGQGVYGLFGLPTWSPPSAQRLADYLDNALVITPVNTTAMQSISFTFKDPKFAAALLSQLQREGDKIIRDEAASVADKQIQYLQQKLQQTTAIDYRQTLLGLISAQMTTRMSINDTLPYAASLVQPAIATDLPTGPNPFVWITIGIVVGLLLGVFLALGAALIWPEGLPALPSFTYRVPGVRRGWRYLANMSQNARPNAGE